MTTLEMQQWLDAMIESAGEFSSMVLGTDGVEVVARHAELPPDFVGSYIALIGEEVLQLGLSSSTEGCQALVRAFMGLESGEEDLPYPDMVDALGEIANIVGGGVKRRMAEVAPQMQLGLPLVVQGRVIAGAKIETAAADIRFGEVGAYLMVLRTATEITAPR